MKKKPKTVGHYFMQISLGVAMLTANVVMAAPGSAEKGTQDRPLVTKEVRFASWGLSCAVALDSAGASSERCMISQIVATNPRQGKVVLGITVDYSDSSKVPTMRARFSADAKPEVGIGIKVDAHPDMRLAIDNCNLQRCEAVGRLSSDVLKVWRSGKSAQLAFLQHSGKQVLLPISLAGFSDALTALSKLPGRPK